MTFDWDEFVKLTDEEKSAYMKEAERRAREEAKGRTYPPGSIGWEKWRTPLEMRVIGRMNPDGTIQYDDDQDDDGGNADTTHSSRRDDDAADDQDDP